MADSVIRSRIDPAIKAEASEILENMGMSMSDAIRVFLHQVIAQRSLPFPVVAPNAKTVAALKAADNGKVSKTSPAKLAAEWGQTAKSKESQIAHARDF
jgi:DNA-damage-inducible protein J